jgi:predicted RNA-binding Zn ribbon-like protein
MSSVPAPGEAARPALALVNSRRNEHGEPIDDLATPAGVVAWLARHGLAPDTRVDDAALAGVRALREAVRELLEARIAGRTPDRAAVETVNAAAAAAPVTRRLTWTAPGAPREERRAVGSGIQRASAVLAGDAIDLVTGPAHADLLACSAPGCVRLLLRDHPRRRWCSTRCGDRVRASRYYHRHREAAPTIGAADVSDAP